MVKRKNKKVLDNNIIKVLKKREKLGRRIIIIEIGKKWKNKKVYMDEV
jgi:hypothetical protein